MIEWDDVAMELGTVAEDCDGAVNFEMIEQVFKAVTHFVGFRDDRYWNAVKIWGSPAFIHVRWDQRAQRDIAEGDIVIFATGDEQQPVSRWNGPDLVEKQFLEAGYGILSPQQPANSAAVEFPLAGGRAR